MQVDIVQDGRVLPKHSHQGTVYAEVPKKGAYAIRLRNDSPSRKLAVVSVDGVSVLDGEDASHDGGGYVLGPWQAIDIPGWRRSDKSVAAFEFKKKGESYAAKTGRGTANVGVIGVAVFDEKVQTPIIIREHHHHHHDHHHDHWPLYPRRPWPWPWTQPIWMTGSEVTCNSASTPSIMSSLSSNGAAHGSLSTKNTDATFSVGTGYGKETVFHTASVAFERVSTTPSIIVSIRYATREQLKKWGVPLDAPVEAVATPNPFPQSMSVPPPPGWQP